MAIAFHYGSLAIHFSGSLNGIWIVTSQWISPIAHDHCHHHLVWLLPPRYVAQQEIPEGRVAYDSQDLCLCVGHYHGAAALINHQRHSIMKSQGNNPSLAFLLCSSLF